MYLQRILLVLFCTILSAPLFAQTQYGTSDSDWRVADNNPVGASVQAEFEPLLGKSVTQTQGAGTTNSYLLGGYNVNTGWNNTNEFLLTWRLQASETINVYIRVETTLGWRYLRYNHSTNSSLLNSSGRVIHHGLGPEFIDGDWHTWSRDLLSDLKNAEPENDLVAINGIVLRGDMRIDGIQLSEVARSPAAVITGVSDAAPLGETLLLNSEDSTDFDGAIIGFVWRDSEGTVLGDQTTLQVLPEIAGTKRYSLEVLDNEGLSAVESVTMQVVDTATPTVYSDGNQDNLDGWRLADKTPEGSAVDNVADPEDDSNRVIQFTSSGTANSFIIGYTNVNLGWNNQLQTNISWRSRASENFRVFARVETTEGWRYIWYDTRDVSRLENSSGRYIHHGLGTGVANGEWQTHTRDLQADLELGQPGNTVLAVHAVVVRGSLLLDDLSLVGNAIAPEPEPEPEPEPIVAPVTPINVSPVVDAKLEAGSTQTFTWQAQAVASSYDFHLFDKTNGALTFVNGIDPAVACNDSTCSIEHTLNLPVSADHAWRVRAKNISGTSSWSRSIFDVVPAITAIPELPIIGSPTNGAEFEPGANITLQWQQDAMASNYQIELRDLVANTVLDNVSITAADSCNATVCSWALPSDLPESEEYQLRLVASNRLGSTDWSEVRFSLAEPFVEPPVAAPVTPINVSPVVDAKLEAGSTQTFTWQAQAVASSYDFHLFDKTNGALTFVNGIDPAVACNDSTCSIEHTLNLPVSADHAWRVRAKNISGTSSWSRSIFDVVPAITAIPELPIISTPANDAEFEPGANIVLQWQQDSTASNYQIELLNLVTNTTSDSVALTASESCNATVCAWTLPSGLAESEGYQLRLVASNRLGSTDWTEVGFSIVEPNVEPPVAAPVVPVNLTPVVNAEIEAGAMQTFTWEAQAVAASYDFHFFDKVSSGLTFVNDIDPAVACNDATCSIDVAVSLPVNTDHAWRVRASNVTDTSSWSRSVFDVVEPPVSAPLIPRIALPAQAATYEVGSEVMLQWQADELARTYDVGLLDPLTDATTYTSNIQASDVCDAINCSFSLGSNLVEASGYEVRVRAVNSVGSSDWSVRSFVVEPPALPSPPSAAFTVSSLTGTAPFSVTVDASGSSDEVGISNYQWDFAGENVLQGSELISASHEFMVSGSFPISLTVTNEGGITDIHMVVVTVGEALPDNAPSEQAAARLLAQASFGANTESINAVRTLGIEGWIDAQQSIQGPAHLDYVLSYSNGSSRDARHEIWWKEAVESEEQLRNRVAFALSQLFVVSDTGFTLGNAQYGITNYYDVLRNNAFGNYRELLEKVTLNPVMGIYLSMLQNDKGDELANTRADENFAREVLQLFSIGVHNLNENGTKSGGSAYTQAQIEDFARVFTGWNYRDAGRWDRPLFTGQDLINPMEPFEDHHDTGAKTLLNGVVLPAGQSARQDLEQALDNIASHPNVAPFVSRHLIMQLVTSNPSSAYVGRVAAVFNNNGNGVKGDLKATVKALLLDSEARNPTNFSGYGKLREPVLRLTHLWRAFAITTGNLSLRGEFNTYSPALKNLESITGQAVLRSPSVFNFYSPDYSPNGPLLDAQLKAPEFDIFTDGNILSTASRVNSQVHRHYKQNPNPIELNPSYLDYSVELELASDPQALLDHLNTLLLSGSMSQALNDVLLNHLSGIADDDRGRLMRVQDAISLLVASPEYLVQK